MSINHGTGVDTSTMTPEEREYRPKRGRPMIHPPESEVEVAVLAAIHQLDRDATATNVAEVVSDALGIMHDHVTGVVRDLWYMEYIKMIRTDGDGPVAFAPTQMGCARFAWLIRQRPARALTTHFACDITDMS